MNPEGNRIWLFQRMKLLRRRGILKQLLHLTIGKSHCYRDLVRPHFRDIWRDGLRGFGKASRPFNRDQITKTEVLHKWGTYSMFDVSFVLDYHVEVQSVCLAVSSLTLSYQKIKCTAEF